LQITPQPQDKKRFGEVIEASTTGFKAQCYELYEAPPLGSLVRTGDESAVYGIVHEVATSSMDPGRHPIARGRDEETEEAVYASNPQLSRLLVTEASLVVVGHRSAGEILRHLPPLPPRIHSFVHRCAGEELREFAGSLELLLATLLASPVIVAPDDVVAAFLREASSSHPDPQQYLLDAGRELARTLSNDVRRLNNVLRRLSP
jgi:hypothetical protein